MKTLNDYKEDSGLSYDKIFQKINGFKCRETTFHAVKNPSRTTRKDFLEVAAVLGMPESDAIEEWNSVKASRIIEKGINEAGKLDIDLKLYLKDYS